MVEVDINQDGVTIVLLLRWEPVAAGKRKSVIDLIMTFLKTDSKCWDDLISLGMDKETKKKAIDLE